MDGGMNIREVRREVQREVQVSVPMPSGFSLNRSIFQQTYSKSFGIAEGVYPPPSPAFPPSRRRASVAEDLRTDRLNTCNNSNEGNDMARVVKYTECRKNYVATIGGYAVDGCGEFMPSAEDDSPDALICAACGCHRSFHRRVFEHPIGCSCCRTLRG